MGTGLEIGQTGLRAAQQAMITAGNNIANANTPGFSRRTPILTAEVPLKNALGFTIGQGVRLAEIRRETAEFLNIRVFDKQSAFSKAETENIRLEDLEGLFNELSDFSLKNAISNFFDATQEVSKIPDSSSARSQMVETAKIMTQTINQMGNDIDDMSTRAKDDIKKIVTEINNLTVKIADLNGKITSLSLTGVPPSELEDQRDVLLNDLSKLIDTNVKTSGDGTTKLVSTGGVELVGGVKFVLLDIDDTSSPGKRLVKVKGSSPVQTVSPNSGELKGLLDFQDTANTAKSDLDNLAKAITDEFNRIHSEGINLNGSFGSAITGENAVNLSTNALNNANLPFTPKSGDIYFTVTNTSTGAVDKTKITVDVTVDDLSALQTSISGSVANITASIVSNKLVLTPASGFTFDFSSSVDPNPTGTGTLPTLATMDGSFTGSNNDVYTFTIVGGPGTIGVTSGLKLRVTDTGTTFTRDFDIGDAYTPGSTIEIGDGLKMTLKSGNVAAGDTFNIDVLNDPDETNLLSALGINRFFASNSTTTNNITANTISVASEIQGNVSLIAAASSNSVGDNTNALRMVDLEFKKISSIKNSTFGEFLADKAAQIGSDSNLSKVTLDSQQATLEALKTLKEQIVGVSIDEELANLLKFEQMFNASARFIAAVNDSVDRILQI